MNARAVVLESTRGALAEVRRIRSLAKKPTKAVIAKALLPSAWAGLALRDFKAATHIRELQFVEQLAEAQLDFAEEPAA